MKNMENIKKVLNIVYAPLVAWESEYFNIL